MEKTLKLIRSKKYSQTILLLIFFSLTSQAFLDEFNFSYNENIYLVLNGVIITVAIGGLALSYVYSDKKRKKRKRLKCLSVILPFLVVIAPGIYIYSNFFVDSGIIGYLFLVTIVVSYVILSSNVNNYLLTSKEEAS